MHACMHACMHAHTHTAVHTSRDSMPFHYIPFITCITFHSITGSLHCMTFRQLNVHTSVNQAYRIKNRFLVVMIADAANMFIDVMLATTYFRMQYNIHRTDITNTTLMA